MPYTSFDTIRCITGYHPGGNGIKYPINCTQYVTRALYESKSRVEKEGEPADITGWRKPNPFSMSQVTAALWKGEVRYWTRYQLQDQLTTEKPYPYGTIKEFNYAFPVPSIPFGMIAKAEVRCLTKIKDKRADLAVTVAETLESASMVGKMATTLFTAYLQVRKGRFRLASKTLGVRRPKAKEPEKAWVEMQLGWAPLVGEIYSQYEMWRLGFRPDGLRLSAVSDCGVEVPPMSRVEVAGQPTQHYQDKGKYGCRVRLDYNLTSAALSAAAGMGLTNPASVVWAVTPMSFLIDWFVPIGDWLNILDADFGLSFKGGSRTLYQKLTRKGMVFWGADTRSGFSYVNLTGAADMVSVVRTVYTKTPIPVPLYTKLPTKFGQALTAFSLARLLL